MKLYICSNCHQHYLDSECPHCVTDAVPPRKKVPSMAFAMLLGLGLTACGDKEEDTAVDSAEEPAAEPDMAALYGVEETGE